MKNRRRCRCNAGKTIRWRAPPTETPARGSRYIGPAPCVILPRNINNKSFSFIVPRERQTERRSGRVEGHRSGDGAPRLRARFVFVMNAPLIFERVHHRGTVLSSRACSAVGLSANCKETGSAASGPVHQLGNISKCRSARAKRGSRARWLLN